MGLAWVSLLRRSPRKSTLGLSGSSSYGSCGPTWDRKLLDWAGASIRVPSTLKHLPKSSPSSSAAHTTSLNKVWPASCARSRGRFLVKTVVSKLCSIRSNAKN